MVFPSGEKLFADSGESAFSSQVSLAPPPPPDLSLLSAKRFVGSVVSPGVTLHRNYWAEGSPRKRGRVGEGADEEECEVDGDEELNDTEDEDEARRGLLFAKGKGVATVDEDIIDLDPSDEDVPVALQDEEDNMSLDDAVGHMSLDGPAPFNSDVDIEGGGDTEDEVIQAPPPISPIQTRAKRRSNQVAIPVVKRGTGKRLPKVRAVGTRTSSRLASKVDVSMSS